MRDPSQVQVHIVLGDRNAVHRRQDLPLDIGVRSWLRLLLSGAGKEGGHQENNDQRDNDFFQRHFSRFVFVFSTGYRWKEGSVRMPPSFRVRTCRLAAILPRSGYRDQWQALQVSCSSPLHGASGVGSKVMASCARWPRPSRGSPCRRAGWGWSARCRWCGGRSGRTRSCGRPSGR